jgi:D-xylose transport system substrate-binding protein
MILMVFSFCSKNQGMKVAFLNPDGSKERWHKDEAFFAERAKAKGIEVIIVDGEGNEQKQYNQAVDLINKGVKVLVIASVNANTAASIVREAHKQDVKVIAYDRLIRNADLDYYVSHNNVQVGEMMAQYVTKIIPNGNYILLFGDRADQNSVFVKEGIMKVIKPKAESGNLKISYTSFIEGWKGVNSEFEVNQFLDFSNDSVDAVIASNDDMAQGVLRAIKAHQINRKIYITGQNADIVGIKSILKDEQSMTVYKPLKDLAYAAADLSYQLLTGKNPDGINTRIFNQRIDVPSILIPVISVDKNNIDEVLIKTGFYTHDKVYKQN